MSVADVSFFPPSAAAGGTELIYADISLEEKGEKKDTGKTFKFVVTQFTVDVVNINNLRTKNNNYNNLHSLM